MKDFIFEGDETEPRIETNFEDGRIDISESFYSGKRFDILRPLIPWMKNYLEGKTSLLLIEIRLEYCGKHGFIGLLELFEYIYEFFPREVKVNLYYTDIDYEYLWIDAIGFLEFEKGINLQNIVRLISKVQNEN